MNADYNVSVVRLATVRSKFAFERQLEQSKLVVCVGSWQDTIEMLKNLAAHGLETYHNHSLQT